MKHSWYKPIAICLCAALTVGSVTAAVYAQKEDPKDTGNAEPVQTADSVKTAETEAPAKDETVYVLAGADGAVQKIIVSDWIKNTLGSASLSDKSELSGVENVKGDETYTMNGDHMRVWDAEGNDIYYQGSIEKELPVQMTVSYTLDGKMIDPSDLAGKSGHVVIRFDYQNNQYETVKIDGKEETIYVPFAMLTGMLLDSDHFQNIEVSNGKLINDGDHTAVIGIAFPGLQSNLNLSKDKLELPDYVEVSADVTDFSMTTTMTVATNDIFSKLDTGKLDPLDGLSDSLGEMTDAMEQLMGGSSALYDGLCTLLDKSEELVSGMDQLAAGAKALKDGAKELNSGAASLKTGASQLAEGLNTLSANNDTLNSGAKQVFETLLSTANTQLAAAGIEVPTLTIDNYAKVLDGVIASLDETAVYQKAQQQVAAAVEKQRPLIEGKVTETVKAQVIKQVTAAVQQKVTKQVTAAVRDSVAEQVIPAATNHQLTKESYEAALAAGQIDTDTQAAIAAAIDAQMQTDAIKQTIEQKVSEQMASETVQSMIVQNTETQMQTSEIKATIADNIEAQVNKAISENMASDAVQSQLKAASEGAKSIITLKASLDSYNSFYLGLRSYTSGVADAAAGAGKLTDGAAALKDGTAQLNTGAGELYNGILQLKNGAPALIEGVTALKDGAMQLSDGLKQFNEQGVQKLVDAVDGDLGSLTARLRATVDVSKDYCSFSGISEEMDGQVKFIYRTDSIDTKE